VIDLVQVGARYRGVVIDLQVRSESGRIVASSHGFEWTRELIDLDTAVFPMLAGLCAYLDTVFNQRQIPILLAELERLPAGLMPAPDHHSPPDGAPLLPASRRNSDASLPRYRLVSILSGKRFPMDSPSHDALSTTR